MGGNPPLGYDVANRKLIVNSDEAETVRLIFQRYLELGCVRLLCADLSERGTVSKHRTFLTGERRGGKPMGRSALYLILNNRTYLGETTHKGASYPGEHGAIVPRALFDAVQERLAELAPAALRETTGSPGRALCGTCVRRDGRGDAADLCGQTAGPALPVLCQQARPEGGTVQGGHLADAGATVRDVHVRYYGSAGSPQGRPGCPGYPADRDSIEQHCRPVRPRQHTRRVAGGRS